MLLRTLIAVLLVAASATAQPAPGAADALPADKLAMQQHIMQLTAEILQWRIQTIELQRRVEELQKQVAALSTPKAPTP